MNDKFICDDCENAFIGKQKHKLFENGKKITICHACLKQRRIENAKKISALSLDERFKLLLGK